MDITEIKTLAERRGLNLVKLTNYHYQIKGVFNVNLYPTTNKVYVNGMSKSMPPGNMEAILDLAEIGKIRHGRKFSLKGIKKEKRQGSKSSKLREDLWNSGVRRCFVCGKELKCHKSSTLEHKIPLAKGGSNRRDNLALSHSKCNKDKGSSL